MTPDLLRRLIRFGVASLLLLAPLPFGSVQPGYVLAIELIAAALGLLAILLIGRDEEARQSVPRAALAVCGVVIALGIFQIIPWPFWIAEKFNPTAELVRPLIPYLGLDHPPAVTWSVAAPETTDAMLRFIAYVLIGLACAVAYNDAASRRRFAIVLVIAAVFQAVYGSGEYLSGRQHIFAFAKKHYLDSATGTFINRNHFATFLALAVPFSLALALRPAGRVPHPRAWRARLLYLASRDGAVQVVAIATFSLIWLGLLLSHSRAGLIASLIAGGIVLYRFRRSPGARWVGLAGAMVLAVLLTTQIARAPGERFLALESDLAVSGGRLDVWRDGFGLVKSRPVLGWGFGAFEPAFEMVKSEQISERYDHAHNDWLEWLIEGGCVSLAAAMIVFIASLRSGTSSGTADPMTWAPVAALVALAVHGFWDFSLRIPAVALVAAPVCAGCLSWRRSVGPETVSQGVRSGVARIESTL